MSKLVNEYMPDVVSPPGDTLAESLEERGMTQVDFAQRIGMSRKHLKQIIDGNSPITPETALKFERVLGIPARFWNNREQRYRDFLARQCELAKLAEYTPCLKNFKHFAKMKTHGWLPESRNPVEVVRCLLEFYAVNSPDAWEAHWQQTQVQFRRSRAHEPDLYALSAWLRKGELEAQKIECAEYDPNAFAVAIEQARALTVEPPEVFQPRLRDLFAAAGVAVVFVPELPKTASGATRWLTPTKALIQLSLRYKTDDHLWFTLFHEAAHILKHPKRSIFIELGGVDSDEEEEANLFAARTLIPDDAYAEIARSCATLTKKLVTDFAARCGIAPGIVVGRLQHDKHVAPNYYNDLKRRFEWQNDGIFGKDC